MKARQLTRRTFIQRSTLALTAPLFCPFPLRGQAAPSNRLNLALIGCGWQGADVLLKDLLGSKQNIIALCDVDETMLAKARRNGGEALNRANTYADYRQLLDREKTLDGVVIATPDHWHATLCTAFMQAGKHVYCEKPLTRTIGEARALGNLAKTSSSITQMGNHGSAFSGLRRAVELIQAGVLGQVSEVEVVSPGERYPTGINRPAGEDPIPVGLNWDAWLGPSPMRPYKKDIYHPYKWRGWLDFGTGQIGNWACHSLNLPIRALTLGYPDRIGIEGDGLGFETYWKGGTITYHFPAVAKRGELTILWHENRPLPASFLEHVPGVNEGVLLRGEKGIIFTDPHNGKARIKLTGEDKFKDVNFHQPTKSVAVSLPRGRNQTSEWIEACQGGGATYSNFVVAGTMTEIALTGLLAVQLGHGFQYDGANMEVVGAPEAAKWIRPPVRHPWV